MKNLIIVVICLVLAFPLASCSCNKEKITDAPYEIENGGFEDGTLSGWTAEGYAFQDYGVVQSGTADGESVGKAGKFYFNGLEAGLPCFTGTMRSTPFKIGGTGYISFLLGAGASSDCYVAVKEANGGKLLFKQANTVCDGIFVKTQMIRYLADLTAHIGKIAYIEVADNASAENRAEYGYLICDDFVTYIADTDTIDKYEAERKAKLDKLLPEVYEEDPERENILNPGFELGTLYGWRRMNGGKTFGDKSIMSAESTFWAEKRDFMAEGDYFLNGYNQSAESDVGAIRSTYFTLGGDGYISFLMGGAKTSGCYIALCDMNTDEVLVKVTNTAFQDPNIALNLTRYYMDASAYKGRKVYIKIVDNDSRGGDFASITADDFMVSLTKAQVQTVMTETYKKAMDLPSGTVNNYIKKYYDDFNYPFELQLFRFAKKAGGQAIYARAGVNVAELITGVAENPGKPDKEVSYAIDKIVFGGKAFTGGFTAFDLTATGTYTVYYHAECDGEILEDSFRINVANDGEILNGGFETGDLAGWEILTEDTVRADSAVTEDVFDFNRAAFNKCGEYFLNGRNATYGESGTFMIKSSSFTLGGSGFISFRMGGRTAEVYVYKADGTRIAKYTNTEFNDLGEFVDKGSRLATMTTFVADLTEYIGQELYIVLADGAGANNWAIAFFDEIKVVYETAPDTERAYDTVMIYATQGGGLAENLSQYKLYWKIAQNKN